MKQFFTLLITVVICLPVFSQTGNVGVNTSSPDESASLEIGSTDKGLLIPKVSLTGTTDITTITGAPYPERLMVYNEATTANVIPGFYYWNGISWVRLKEGVGGDQDLSLTGNTLSLTGDPTTVDLSGYLDNTDDQTVDVLSLVGTVLQLSLENDGQANKTLNLSGFMDNTDEQEEAHADSVTEKMVARNMRLAAGAQQCHQGHTTGPS